MLEDMVAASYASKKKVDSREGIGVVDAKDEDENGQDCSDEAPNVEPELGAKDEAREE